MTFRDEIIKHFMLRAKKGLGIRSGLDKFKDADVLINCWIAFEAFSCDRYKKDGVGERIANFCTAFEKEYKNNYAKLPDVSRENVEALSKKTIGDMRPSHLTDKPKKITDIKDLKQVMEVIYQVRNNLFHGGKNPAGNDDDFEKVRLSANVFYQILERYFIQSGLSW